MAGDPLMEHEERCGKDSTTIRFMSENITVQILDLQGKVTARQTVSF
jgi:hypothetical protein